MVTASEDRERVLANLLAEINTLVKLGLSDTSARLKARNPDFKYLEDLIPTLRVFATMATATPVCGCMGKQLYRCILPSNLRMELCLVATSGQ